MAVRFNWLKFQRTDDASTYIKNTNWEFFIPGVNSGSYSPASLHISVRIDKRYSGFFTLRRDILYSDLTLSNTEFDALFEEMKKIKAFRDFKVPKDE